MSTTNTTLPEGRKTSIYLPKTLKKRLDHAVIDHEMMMTDAIIEAIELWLKKKEAQRAA